MHTNVHPSLKRTSVAVEGASKQFSDQLSLSPSASRQFHLATKIRNLLKRDMLRLMKSACQPNVIRFLLCGKPLLGERVSKATNVEMWSGIAF